MGIHSLFASYFLIINAAAFGSMRIDKGRAVKKRWRIPERTLMLLAALGGSVGSLLGMYLFHHKTKKPKFYIGIPAILLIQVTAALLYFR